MVSLQNVLIISFNSIKGTIKTNAGVKEGFLSIEFQFHKRYD